MPKTILADAMDQMDYPVTKQSIRNARTAQMAARLAFKAQTGIKVPAEGFEVPPLVVAKALIEQEHAATIIGCPQPGCHYAASARSEGRAIAALCGHLVEVHCQAWKRKES